MYNEGPRAGTDKNLFAITRFSYNKVLFHIYFTITGAKKIVHYTEDFILWRFIISRFHCTIIIKWKDIRIPVKWNLFGTTFAWYYLFLQAFSLIARY